MILDKNVKQQIKELILKKESEIEQRIVIISTYKLDNEEVGYFKKFLNNKGQADIQNVIDTDILGGFIIKYGSKMIDFSLRGRLQQLKYTLYENT